MFILTRPRLSAPKAQFLTIPSYDIIIAQVRGNQTEQNRLPDAQTAQRLPFRSSVSAGIVATYDADLIPDIDRGDTPKLVCPVDMTGYTQGEWTVSASREKYGDTLAWMAFNPEDGWRSSEWGAGSMPCWIQWSHATGTVRVREYTIKGSESWGGPLSWELQGKNLDETSWTLLDRREQSSWPNKITRTFQIPNNKLSFQSHRLYFTKATDGDNPIACIWAYSAIGGS